MPPTRGADDGKKVLSWRGRAGLGLARVARVPVGVAGACGEVCHCRRAPREGVRPQTRQGPTPPRAGAAPRRRRRRRRRSSSRDGCGSVPRQSAGGRLPRGRRARRGARRRRRTRRERTQAALRRSPRAARAGAWRGAAAGGRSGQAGGRGSAPGARLRARTPRRSAAPLTPSHHPVTLSLAQLPPRVFIPPQGRAAWPMRARARTASCRAWSLA